MTAVPQQTLEFLAHSAPFDQLPAAELEGLCKHMQLVYLSQDNLQDIIAQQGAALYLIQSGQFSVKDSDGPQRHLSEGDYFNFNNLLNNLNYPLTVQVESAGLVYCLGQSHFARCLEASPAFRRFFESYQSQALESQAVADSNSMWLHRCVGEMVQRAPVSIESDVSIVDGVRLMSKQGVSSLLITEDGVLAGIITDRDIRNRIVATRQDLDAPLADIMTREPAMISHQKTMFDALAKMTERNIHHLPVVDAQTREPLGMLTASDMIRHQRGNVLFIVDELARADSLYDLSRLSWQMPHYFAQHAKRLGDFDIAGKVLSQATDIMTRKLIAFFQQQHGSPPCDYCWLVYGSQAREDQTMGSDQDNGLLLARELNEDESRYFAEMSDYVCKGLSKCGIRLCEGNIMASNPDLRLSVEGAVKEAQRWISAPTPKAIMHFNIFLDVRPVAGNLDLFDKLQKARMPLLKQPMFLAALARHTNDVNVPLSMFKKFVFEKKAESDDCIDLKTNAVAIINNIVRIYSLANGIGTPSTPGRLNKIRQGTELSTQDADNLRDIWLFLNRLRWRHQLSHNVTNNRVSISDLSSIEKHQLKAAFEAVKRAQQAVVMRFSGGVG